MNSQGKKSKRHSSPAPTTECLTSPTVAPLRDEALPTSSNVWFVADRNSLTMITRFILWSAVILIAVGWQSSCGFVDYDIHASFKAQCTVRRSEPDKCLTGVSPHCISPGFISRLSPSTVGKFVVMIGPVWVWIPMLAWVYTQTAASRRADSVGSGSDGPRPPKSLVVAVRIALIISGLWFLAFIQPMRFMAEWLGGGIRGARFDPSGHIFIFGLQLVPLWVWLGLQLKCANATRNLLTSPTGGPPVSFASSEASYRGHGWQRVARVAEAFIWYLAFATAAFFHSWAEITTSWLVTLAFAVVCGRITSSIVDSPEGTLSESSKQLLIGVLIVAATTWFVATVATTWMLVQEPNSRLLNMLAMGSLYDGGVAAMVAWLIYTHS